MSADAISTTIPRSQVHALGDVAYLNTARHAPLPQVAVRAAERVLRQQAASGSGRWMDWDARHADVRSAGARLLGAPAESVSFTKNTTELLSVVANGLDLGEGRRVVLPAHEFPSNRLMWLALRDRGVRVDLLEAADPVHGVTIEEWAGALVDGADVVATSWVQSHNGGRTDLAALADLTHRAGGVLVVDAIQGVGVVPAQMAAWGVDAAGAAAFKWLLGPEGIALAFLSESLRGRLRPLQTGWYSAMHTTSVSGVPPALAFTEGGSPNSVGIAALGASIDLLLESGVEATWSHVQILRTRLVEGLRALGWRMQSPVEGEAASAIVLAGLDGVAPASAGAALEAGGVVASVRSDGIRFSLHGFNHAADVDRCLAGAQSS